MFRGRCERRPVLQRLCAILGGVVADAGFGIMGRETGVLGVVGAAAKSPAACGTLRVLRV
jgi:hypothetical protein